MRPCQQREGPPSLCFRISRLDQVVDSIVKYGDTAGMAFPGGKAGAGTYQKIINLMPPHSLYIEPFLGGGAIMRLKKPAARNIGIEIDPLAAGLLRGSLTRRDLTIITGDGLAWLQEHGPRLPADALVYCDPPYLLETRKSGPLYRYEFTTAQHETLLALLRQLPCQVMISGYWSPLYAEALRGWQTMHFEVTTRGGSRATEWLWCNFAPPAQLYDYRYVGNTFRERERIKRKTQRWKAKLLKMSALERQVLIAALAEVTADPPSPELASSAGATRWI